MTTQQYYMKLTIKKIFKIILPSGIRASNAPMRTVLLECVA